MLHPARPLTLLAAAGAAAIALSGCGSAQDSGGGDASGGSPSATASPSPSQRATDSGSGTPTGGGSSSSMPMDGSSSMPMDGASSMPSRTATGGSHDMGGGHMMHGTADMPQGMKPAASPQYPVGTPVTLQGGHMPGMDGAKGTVSGVFDTTAYVVTYTPTDGGPQVKDHQWVVQEEIQGGAQHGDYAPGDTVTLQADHMPGMQGAQATIVESVKEPVYAVDYQPTDGGPQVTNHLWMTQSELAPAS